MAIRPTYGDLPPLVSGLLTARRYHSAQLAPGAYESALGDFDLQFDRFDVISRIFAMRGMYEWRIAAVASALLKPGDVVFEGGAHYGTETLYYGWLVGEQGCVVSYEADTALAERLTNEVARQGMRQCSVLTKALGPKAGTAVFEPAPEPLSNSGLGSLAPADRDDGSGPTVEVATLDQAMATFGSPRLLVMDIQGGEFGALQGGQRVLEEARPTVVLEVEAGSLSRLGSSADEVQSLLEQHGYRCWRLTRAGLRSVRSPRSDELCDWLAVPGERGTEVRHIRTALAMGAVTRPASGLSPFGRARKRRDHRVDR